LLPLLLQLLTDIITDRTTEQEAQELLEMVLQWFSSPELANVQDAHGMTPLHFAGRFGNILAIEMLYKTFGEVMDVQAVNADGLTALEEAKRRVFHDIEDLGRLARKEYNIRTNQTVRLLEDITRSQGLLV
jgi:ankyrin repeat protein